MPVLFHGKKINPDYDFVDGGLVLFCECSKVSYLNCTVVVGLNNVKLNKIGGNHLIIEWIEFSSLIACTFFKSNTHYYTREGGRRISRAGRRSFTTQDNSVVS